ncbi:hypothetical protein A3D01_06415 [Candidatus Woesebacteria bacterium RIFCSPHIGHO2_02_FULL_39_13]|uniref:Uncharacterized protein n=1 Tax=Candidatus Woesebacteria bacterium RIFCSPHIGHO2_02_FULL_39_13 TaxID=1802505 RepID=A0A1F7Z2K0_9BACT|nr:MAG: hypothetical protein A3D01_06415 [Candidatus Woesebacteria bacterium RIFCSPHIGHO2_02_FULL_39_13]
MVDEFYTPEGQIKDPNAAQEVATLEKPARDRELELRRQATEGVSERERGFLEIMTGLKVKYPDAFEVHVDDKGREVLVMPPVLGSRATRFSSQETIFTQGGVMGIDATQKVEDLNLTNLVDLAIKKGDEFGAGGAFGMYESMPKSAALKPGTPDTNTQFTHIALQRLNLQDNYERGQLKEAFQLAQEQGLRLKVQKTTTAVQQSPQTILTDL